ncbi:hypothetical protein Pint_24889 [Pistacia integerrima]|uniref:Uncharacterized protein n=1 Tax=Pistacia integerrima TaxID=434235 RepID=A0ACC0YG74_9ROSI|nr:hypothetical protein Pint_24889 [Pistacia integerrima]
MREREKLNAIRSGIVVIGFLAFGYLSLELGFKPFLLKAQQLQEQEHSQQQNHSASTSTPTPNPPLFLNPLFYSTMCNSNKLISSILGKLLLLNEVGLFLLPH